MGEVDLIARLRATYSHRGDGLATQLVNPDGPEAAARIEELTAQVGRVEREKALDTKAVWRCAVGDLTGAIDILKNLWVGSKRKAEREAGAVLSRVADYMWAYRDPAPENYEEAFPLAKPMHERVRHAVYAPPRAKEEGE